MNTEQKIQVMRDHIGQLCTVTGRGSHAALADASGISDQSLRNFIKYGKAIMLATAMDIAEALGTSLDVLTDPKAFAKKRQACVNRLNAITDRCITT